MLVELFSFITDPISLSSGWLVGRQAMIRGATLPAFEAAYLMAGIVYCSIVLAPVNHSVVPSLTLPANSNIAGPRASATT
tara:strand:- start:11401 stop:11640 length:240 start_codon:yes stop_codon:yes gene_type:complete